MLALEDLLQPREVLRELPLRALREAGTPLDELLWEHRDAPDGVELSQRLKRAGFRFVGPTTVYSSLEACGIVNGHRPDCWVRAAVEAERARSS